MNESEIQQTPSQISPEEILSQKEEDLNEKLKLVERKKRNFQRLLFFIITGIIAAILLIGTGLAINRVVEQNKKPFTTQTVPGEDDNKPAIPKEEISWGTYQSDKLKIKFDYPSNSNLTETDLSDINPQKVEVRYSQDESVKNQDLDETNLTNGYIFRVVLLDISDVKTYEATVNLKRQGYIERCPKTAQISKIYATNISGQPSSTFFAENCGVEYKVTFTSKFGMYYEITQIFAGSVGIRQQHFTSTEKMLNSINLYFDPETESKPDEPYTTYTNNSAGFSIRHPNMDAKCCTIQQPVEEGDFTGILTLSDTQRNGVIGFFIAKNTKLAFEEYVENQKVLLTADYKTVLNQVPTTTEENVEYDQFRGIRLKGYSWRGHDFIYSKTDKGAFLVIVISQENPEFEDMVLDILNTYRNI